MRTDDMALSLAGKRILVTGVSRPMGIGVAIARVLAEAGARVLAHGDSSYDAQMDYPDAGSDANLSQGITRIADSDLSASGAPVLAVRSAAEVYGGLDGMVLNHAYSVCAPIGEWTEEHIRAHMEVNVVAAMLMIQEFARLNRGGGAITLFTSGQYLGPMTKEIAYAVSKEAIIGLCKQTSAALMDRNIRVNCVNPGPTDTGYLTGEAHAAVAAMFPLGKWGTAEDAARLVRFLQSDYAGWITGEVIASEGGFRRG